MTSIDFFVYFAATMMMTGAGSAKIERVARDVEVVQRGRSDTDRRLRCVHAILHFVRSYTHPNIFMVMFCYIKELRVLERCASCARKENDS
jgi:hypothetical protein